MELFEKASREKLRFNSVKGLLTTEDLWDLSLQDLNGIAKGLKKDLTAAEEEDFLEDISKENLGFKFKFDIVLHVLNTKKDERDKKKKMAEKKAQKEKILNVLKDKQDESLKVKSEDELKKMLEDLD